MASHLLNQVIEGIFNTFLQVDKDGMKMKHTTTQEVQPPLLEDFVFFAEAQLRLFEISANEIFKQNLKDALAFITKEFLENNKMLTRAKMADNFHPYPNQEYNCFDASFKSPVSTYILLMRRAAVLFGHQSYLQSIAPLVENVSQTILKINPISAGEALRALTYPDYVLRVMKVPQSWIQKEEFLKFLPYFLSRFVLDYRDSAEESFEICNLNSCELQGKGIAEFIKILTPAQPNNNEGTLA